jgi:Tfp pilus assembly protein PilZ
MSRRDPRIRAQLAVTITLAGSGDVYVCRTRDISHRGCFLDTAQMIEVGAHLHIAIMDQQRGLAMEVTGEVMRCLPPGKDGLGRGVGLSFDDPPPEWNDLVAAYEAEHRPAVPMPARLRILVLGDRKRQRSAMALYVTSGWDVRFAADTAGAEDALEDERCFEFLDLAMQHQPSARRIVRADLQGRPAPASSGSDDLFHRVVDRNAGIEPLLDALIADF